jgi:multiple sugar transport system substrate-binding protein
MKKFLALLMMLVVVFSLSACGGSKSTSDNLTSSKGSSSKSGSTAKQITITYANWNLGTPKDQNVERLMIKAFEQAHPNIKVQIDNSINTSNWDGTLTTAASAGKLPDVFMLDQVPLSVSNSWLLNLNDLTKNDPDFAKIPQKVVDGAKYNENLYALPFAQHFLGYYVNEDLFNKANLNAPQYGISLSNFEKDVKQITNVNSGVVGLADAGEIPDWYPVTSNKNLGYFTYNNGQFNLDGKEFIDGVNLSKSFVTNGYSFSDLSDSQKSNFKGGKDVEKSWEQGGIAFKWDGTWSMYNMNQLVSFNWDFIGIPGGRPVITNDFLGISSTTKNPQAAYEFAKWMSFGKAGFEKRMALSKQKGVAMNTLPIINDQDLQNQYFQTISVPGVKEEFKHLNDAVVEPTKIVPGYVDARWNAPTGVKIGKTANANVAALITACTQGQLKIEDYAKQLNQLANKAYQDAEKKIEAATK